MRNAGILSDAHRNPHPSESAHEIAKLIGPDATLIEIWQRRWSEGEAVLRRSTGRAPMPASKCRAKSCYARPTIWRWICPILQVIAICADFLTPISLPPHCSVPAARRVAFFPGASIGSFTQAEATQFLARCRAMIGAGGDMCRRRPEKVEAGSTPPIIDAAGVTADFTWTCGTG